MNSSERRTYVQYICYCEEYSCMEQPGYDIIELFWGEFHSCIYSLYIFTPLVCPDKVAWKESKLFQIGCFIQSQKILNRNKQTCKIQEKKVQNCDLSQNLSVLSFVIFLTVHKSFNSSKLKTHINGSFKIFEDFLFHFQTFHLMLIHFLIL